AGNVGVDQGRDAHILESFGDVEGAERGRFRPTRDRHHAVASIERDRDAGRVEARGLGDEGRVAHRRGADDDPGGALVEAGLDGGRGLLVGPRMRSPAATLTGLPAKAPSRSTTWRYSNPSASKACACAAGSRLNTVACAMSPCLSRTARPSLRSMAGNRITASTSGNSRSVSAPAAGSSPDGTGCRPWCRGRRWR